MSDITFANAAAESCFDTKLHACADPACKRGLCAGKNLGFDEASQSCRALPGTTPDGFEFIGWGYCQDQSHSYYDFYRNVENPTPYNTREACAAKCLEVTACQSFELITGGATDTCYFNTDPDDRDTNLDAQIPTTWTYHPGYTSHHPVYTSAGDRRHQCYAKNPTPPPTPACTTNQGLGFSSLGCCPARVLPVARTSHCYSRGDPHIVQFD